MFDKGIAFNIFKKQNIHISFIFPKKDDTLIVTPFYLLSNPDVIFKYRN